MSVFVFPTEGQDSATQSKDEAECYSWAVENAGTDPFDLAKQAEAAAKDAEQTKKQAQQAGQGAGARGAIRGAAVGALIGEIADDDAGEGAAYGAAAGMIASRRRARWGQQQASQQARYVVPAAEHNATEHGCCRAAHSSSTEADPHPCDEPTKDQKPDDGPSRRRYPPTRLPWAELMARVFAIDVLQCSECHGRMRILAAIHPPDVTRAILECLGLPPRPPPLAPARPAELEPIPLSPQTHPTRRVRKDPLAEP